MENELRVKPGYLTTEFWLPTALLIATLAKLFGVDIDEASVRELVFSGVAFAGAVTTVVGYVMNRARVKSAALQAAAVKNISESASLSNSPLTLTLGRP